MLTEHHVVKIQRSVSTNNTYQQILIYNEDRSINMQINATDSVMQLFAEDEFKVYYNATFTGGRKGGLEINNKANTQNW